MGGRLKKAGRDLEDARFREGRHRGPGKLHQEMDKAGQNRLKIELLRSQSFFIGAAFTRMDDVLPLINQIFEMPSLLWTMPVSLGA